MFADNHEQFMAKLTSGRVNEAAINNRIDALFGQIADGNPVAARQIADIGQCFVKSGPNINALISLVERLGDQGWKAFPALTQMCRHLGTVAPRIPEMMAALGPLGISSLSNTFCDSFRASYPAESPEAASPSGQLGQVFAQALLKILESAEKKLFQSE